MDRVAEMTRGGKVFLAGAIYNKHLLDISFYMKRQEVLYPRGASCTLGTQRKSAGPKRQCKIPKERPAHFCKNPPGPFMDEARARGKQQGTQNKNVYQTNIKGIEKKEWLQAFLKKPQRTSTNPKI